MVGQAAALEVKKPQLYLLIGFFHFRVGKVFNIYKSREKHNEPLYAHQ